MGFWSNPVPRWVVCIFSLVAMNMSTCDRNLRSLRATELGAAIEKSIVDNAQHLAVVGGQNIDNTQDDDDDDDDELHPKVRSIILLRAIGNSLPPRHSPTQTLDNLRFALENEELFPRMTRHWMINHIWDPKVEADIVQLLEEHKETYTITKFNQTIFQDIPLRFDRVHEPRFMPTQNTKQTDFLAVHLERLVYAINVNGIRNQMIDYGKTNSTADYILPWDGNCFLSRQAWTSIQYGLNANPTHNYFFVPMDRLREENVALLNDTYVPNPVEEPQIIFSRQSTATFNPGLPYSYRNKVELFARLEHGRPKVETKFEPWIVDIVESESFAEDAGPGLVPRIGWVSRMYSGEAQLESDMSARYYARNTAMNNVLSSLDTEIAESLAETRSLSLFDGMTNRLAARKAKYISDLVLKSKNKTKLLTMLLQHAVVDLVMLNQKNGDESFLDEAAELVNQWVTTGDDDQHFSISDWSDRYRTSFPEFLEAMRVLIRHNKLSEESQKVVTQRFRVWLKELEASMEKEASKFVDKPLPVKSRYPYSSTKGLWLDIQIAAVGYFIEDYYEVRPAVYRAIGRLARWTKSPSLAGRVRTAHQLHHCNSLGTSMASMWTHVEHLMALSKIDLNLIPDRRKLPVNATASMLGNRCGKSKH